MSYKANEARRHKIPWARYKVGNWSEYDRALQHRGSLTLWVTPEALAAWHPPGTGRRGRSPRYAEIAIETDQISAPQQPNLQPPLSALLRPRGGYQASGAHH